MEFWVGLTGAVAYAPMATGGRYSKTHAKQWHHLQSAHLDSSDFGTVSLGMDITLDVRLSTEFGLKLPSE